MGLPIGAVPKRLRLPMNYRLINDLCNKLINKKNKYTKLSEQFQNSIKNSRNRQK